MINQLFFRKLLMAFIVAFLGAFLTALEGISKEPTFHWSRSFVIGLVVGALSAAVRAVLALSPINVVPSDSQHSIVHLKNGA